MRKMEISPKLYIDVMNYSRDIVICKISGGLKCGFPNVNVYNLGGAINGEV